MPVESDPLTGRLSGAKAGKTMNGWGVLGLWHAAEAVVDAQNGELCARPETLYLHGNRVDVSR